MANATSIVQTQKTGYLSTENYWPIPTTAATYYPGAMVGALASDGYAYKFDDTQALKFLGIIATTPQKVVSSTTPTAELILRIDKPRLFSMALSAGTASRLTDLGKPVYAAYDNAVTMTPTTYGNLVGTIEDVQVSDPRTLTGSTVVIKPAYAGESSLFAFPVGTVAGAGSAQGNATSLTAQLSYVTGADNTVGVVLPAASPGLTRMVYNMEAANGLKVYPASGDDINDGSANAAVTIEGKTLAIFIAMDNSTWAAIYTANT